MLLDTHVWAWTLSGDPFIRRAALEAIHQSEQLLISAVSLYEIAHKVRLGKWPQMEPFAPRLADLAAEQSVFIAPVTAEISLGAGMLDWSHRDPFDRHLAATALWFGLPLISADPAFDGVPDLARVWE